MVERNCIADRCLEYQVCELLDPVGCFGRKDELIRSYRSTLRVRPSDQGLRPADPVCMQVHLRLVGGPDLAVTNSPVELA